MTTKKQEKGNKQEKKKEKNKSLPNPANKENGTQKDSGLSDIVTINRLTPENAEFYLTNGGFIGMKENGEDKGRIGLFRMTPISEPTRHISVRNMDMKEIGIIYDIDEFSKGQKQYMEEELKLRYFTPVVKEITNIKEEYGYTFVTAVTDAGTREFTMRDLSNSVIFLSAIRALIIDTDGNRYLIENIREMSDKAMRVIGVWA